MVNCTNSYCGTPVVWTNTGALTQLSPSYLFSGNQYGGPATVTATYDDGINPPSSADAYVSIFNLITPDTFITLNPPELTNDADATFAFACDQPSCTYVCSLDGSWWSDCSSPLTYQGLSNGSHTFEVSAISGFAEDPTPATWIWGIGLTGPVTVITDSPPSPTTQQDAIFSFVCLGGPCTFECQLDGAGWSSCLSPVYYTGLGDGTHIFDVRATDEAHNTDPNPPSDSWIIDLTPPETQIATYPTNPSKEASPSFHFTCIDASLPCTFECQLDSGDWNACSATSTFGPLSEGPHTIDARLQTPWVILTQRLQAMAGILT